MSHVEVASEPTTATDAWHRTFVDPPARSRPTPLFWWSGGDVTRERLTWHLDALAGSGVGGTIVGYSHLPDGRPDAGSPEPFTAAWWELFTWFVRESASRGLTVGVQDYNFISEALRVAGADTADLHGGSLTHVDTRVAGPARWSAPVTGRPITVVLVPAEEGSEPVVAAWTVGDGNVTCDVPAGHWTVCAVSVVPGELRGRRTTFDPMHPDAAKRHVELFYEPFATHLGDLLGTAFTTFFQDELDLGVRMPMVNDLVLQALQDGGHDPALQLAALWHDLGPCTAQFRAAYSDTVVGLLQENYFRPVFQWVDAHGAQLCMDQLSRGDLRAGREHYGDYCATMRWYHGPGNDDPKLQGPRAIASFKVSASIAALNDRPLVFDEAFYGSGWGVGPGPLRTGLDQAMALGANHIALHGLYCTTEGGWWEWASPDFHHRQPWWRDAGPLWAYVNRLSHVLRSGHAVCDVAVLDPTQDLDLCGPATTSPELAVEIVTHLTENTVDTHVLDREHLVSGVSADGALHVGTQTYRVLVVPGMGAVRADTRAALERFVDAGGQLVVVDGDASLAPTGNHQPPVGTVSLDRRDLGSLAEELHALTTLDVVCPGPLVYAAHRRVEAADVFWLTNASGAARDGVFRLRARGRVERWDAWTGARTPLPSRTVDGVSEVYLELPAQASALLVVTPGAPVELPAATAETLRAPAPLRVLHLDGWTARPLPSLDNRHGDLVARSDVPDDLLPVASWFVDVVSAQEPEPASRLVGETRQFWVVGPVPAGLEPAVEELLKRTTHVDPTEPFEVGAVRLPWRSCRFSTSTGLVGDPLLQDTMTGPHGLKGVSETFLDPGVLDEDAPVGSSWWLWTTVAAEQRPLRLTLGARSPVRAWVDGVLVAEVAEQPVVTFPPWNLADRSTFPVHTDVAGAGERSSLLLRMGVVAGQRSRAYAVLHTGAAEPVLADGQHLPWWRGNSPALTFEPDPGRSDASIIRVPVPPGAVSAELSSWEESLTATVGDQPATVTVVVPGSATSPAGVRVSLPAGLSAGTLLELGLPVPGSGREGAGVLAGPVVWRTTSGPVPCTRWTDLGLSDFSGVVVFSREVPGLEPGEQGAELRLTGLTGSARITVDGRHLATVLNGDATVDVSAALTPGRHVLEIENANTLANVYARLPSPYSPRSAAGGGFTAAALHFLG